MKLTFVFLTAFLLNVSAKSLAQKVTLNVENVTIEKVFREIKRQTGYGFIYTKRMLEDAGRITIHVINEPVNEVLKYCFSGKALVYSIENNTIVISRRPKSVITSLIYNIPFNQELEIHGTVKGENGNPLEGVSVIVKGSENGTATNIRGEYKLSGVDENAVLIFSIVGYEPKQVPVNRRGTINVILKLFLQKQDEVVVIAYGTSAKKNLTGSVSQIPQESLADLTPTITVGQALQGQAAGVMVTQESGQPGSATRVRIRGSSSLLGSNQPLYVVDGIPVEDVSNIPNDGSNDNEELMKLGISSPLPNINVDDIASISILKDASATAIYGSRAANGVVIITTKKGSGIPTYSLSSSLSSQIAQTEDVLNAAQFREIWTEAVNNGTSTSAFAKAIRDGSYFGDANTSWQDEVTPENPITKNLNLSISGSTDKIRYYTGFGIQDQTGSFKSAFFKRYNFLGNLNMAVSKKLNIGTSINMSSSQQGAPDGALLSRIYTFPPDLPVFDENGEYAYSEWSSFENPVALSQVQNTNRTNLLLGSVYATFKVLKSLELRSSLAVNYNNGKYSSYYPGYTYGGGYSRFRGPGSGSAQQSASEAISTLMEHTLTFHKVINKHGIDAVVGAAWQGDNNEFIKASGEGFPQNNILTNLSSASEDFTIASNKVQSGLISYFGRVNYQYNQKYLLTLSARTDGSSKFAKENKWAFFPTVAAAWRISEEKLFRNSGFLDELKLRASIGLTGQQSFGAYQWRTLFEATNYGGAPGVIQNQLGNDKLKWELTKQTDIGLDFALFESRINGTLDWYQKNTSDLLYFFKIPGNTGFETVIGNLGSTQNTGFEITLDGDIVRNRNFLWNLAVNISFNRNKLVKLNDDYLQENGYINPPNTGSLLKVGEPIGLIYGYVSEGIFQTQKEIDALNAASGGNYQSSGTAPGDLKFKDINGDGKVTSLDQSIIGNALPNYSGGFTNTIEYKGIRLSSLFTYVVGNDLRWGTQSANINFMTQGQENKFTSVLNRWTPENHTNQPRAVFPDPNNNRRISSYYVHKGTYLRLKNLYLSYDLPVSVMSKVTFLKNISVYVSGSNLFTVTKYPGANPETSNLYNDDVSAGLDNSRYPISKVYTFGLKVNF